MHLPGLKHSLCWLGCTLALLLAGCGTTRRSDTARTATEQLLLTDAIDRSISRIDFNVLAGKRVYLDTTYLATVVDKDYVISTMRQHMVACACILSEKKEDATIVVEARAGAVGTDRHDVLFGTPATNLSLGALSPVPGVPASMPEIALSKRTDQQGVAKIGVFAYERATGAPVWQSGSEIVASESRDLWVFGTGPFQKGTIHSGTQFAGHEMKVPLVGSKPKKNPPVRVARGQVFNPQLLAKKDEPLKQPATTTDAATPTPNQATTAAVPPAVPGPAVTVSTASTPASAVAPAELATGQAPNGAVPQPIPPGAPSNGDFDGDGGQATSAAFEGAAPMANVVPPPPIVPAIQGTQVEAAPRQASDAAWPPLAR